MQISNDDVIWKIIGENNFCSFKFITPSINYCKNDTNVTGLCTRQACPLSNIKYATVIEKEGDYFLLRKIVEKSRYPNKSWAKIPLSRNYIKAIQQIDLNLAFWPKFFLFKVKQRLTKLHQIKVRKKLKILNSKKHSEFFISSKINIKTRNECLKFNRNFEKAIEHELLNRLHFGVYGKIYNMNPVQIARKIHSFNEIRDETRMSYILNVKKNNVSETKRILTI